MNIWDKAKQKRRFHGGNGVATTHLGEVGNKELAATYSRGSYTTTTIGKAAFDGRVRDGIGSDHSFMATKKCFWQEGSGRLITREAQRHRDKREQEFFLHCASGSLWFTFACKRSIGWSLGGFEVRFVENCI